MDDERFMRRALELAAVPLKTSPNPRVGAVVVRDDELISEGFHQGRGNPHAEAVALEGIDATGATAYVNLEPCNHHATTPPCTEALIRAGVQRVVVAIEDPDERVAGAGIARLKDEGIVVDMGVLASEATALNRPYIHHRATGRSFVCLKLAQSIDGRLAAPEGSGWITSGATRQMVHQRRARVDGVMVGAGTVAADDPQLTARSVIVDTQPTRIIVDSGGRTKITARVFSEDAPTIIATTDRCAHEQQLAYKAAGAELSIIPADGTRVDLRALLEDLGRRDMVEILCEGGAELASSLLRQGLVDELEIHTGPLLLGAGPQVAELGISMVDDSDPWTLCSVQGVGDDVIAVYRKWGP